MNKPKPQDRQRRDEDSAWKELLDRHFTDFLKFFFPVIHAAIDWTHKPVFLDMELPKLAPQHLRSHRLADKLAKVWRKDGRLLFVILHGEIQRKCFVYQAAVQVARSQIGTFNVGSMTSDKFQGLFIAVLRLGFDFYLDDV